jgi:uncharacterized short protein YbdD (DUF466 family)
MSPITIDVSPLETSNASRSGDIRRRSVFDHLRDVRQVCRQVFGIPDYERYLAHVALRHPDQPVLSRRAYCAQAIEHKYGKSGPRCC